MHPLHFRRALLAWLALLPPYCFILDTYRRRKHTPPQLLSGRQKASLDRTPSSHHPVGSPLHPDQFILHFFNTVIRTVPALHRRFCSLYWCLSLVGNTSLGIQSFILSPSLLLPIYRPPKDSKHNSVWITNSPKNILQLPIAASISILCMTGNWKYIIMECRHAYISCIQRSKCKPINICYQLPPQNVEGLPVTTAYFTSQYFYHCI